MDALRYHRNRLKKQLLVENPHDREGYLKMKEKTPARIGIGDQVQDIKL